METLCSNYRLVKGGQKGVFPKTYTRNCDRLLILINDRGIIKTKPQEKKTEVRGSPTGGLRGGSIYVVTVHKYPHLLRPHWVTPGPQFFFLWIYFD